MNNYLTTVRFTQTQPDGMSKTITEQYFVWDADNFAEAENITYNIRRRVADGRSEYILDYVDRAYADMCYKTRKKIEKLPIDL